MSAPDERQQLRHLVASVRLAAAVLPLPQRVVAHAFVDRVETLIGGLIDRVDDLELMADNQVLAYRYSKEDKLLTLEELRRDRADGR